MVRVCLLCALLQHAFASNSVYLISLAKESNKSQKTFLLVSVSFSSRFYVHHLRVSLLASFLFCAVGPSYIQMTVLEPTHLGVYQSPPSTALTHHPLFIRSIPHLLTFLPASLLTFLPPVVTCVQTLHPCLIPPPSSPCLTPFIQP